MSSHQLGQSGEGHHFRNQSGKCELHKSQHTPNNKTKDKKLMKLLSSRKR